MPGEDPVDQRLEGVGQDQGAGAVDDHQEEAAGEQPPPRSDERPDFRPDVFEFRFGAGLCEVGGGRAAGSAGRRIGRAHAGCATHIGHSVICHLALILRCDDA